MTTTHDETVADRLEHEARLLMARLHRARGWDTARGQVDDRAHLDAIFDSYNELGH